MSFLEHLEELRQRLVRSVIALVVGFGVCFYFSDNIYGYLAKPLTDTLHALKMSEKLVYTNPVDPFNLYIKLSLVAGLFLASPFILWQIWLFVSPGLYRHEKRYVWPFVGLTSGLFITGGFFAYKLAFPAALKFLVEFGKRFQPMISINEYWNLALTIIVGVGLVFELPVVILILSIFGIVTPKFLIRQTRYAVLITAVVAAAIAPTPDWTTLFMFWIPMVGLYVVSIGLSWLVQLRRNWKKKHAQAS
ncbi:MAG TPA: twin-arginine translocase subunit TatC [Terriglobia bacterium]|jgi:sec-independent protein translocase protein TatC|nr:twin-arginine translocase subunit TatC [Terriglobia bacterium]